MIEQQTSQSEKFDEDVTDYIILAMLENILPWNLFLSIWLLERSLEFIVVILFDSTIN